MSKLDEFLGLRKQGFQEYQAGHTSGAQILFTQALELAKNHPNEIPPEFISSTSGLVGDIREAQGSGVSFVNAAYTQAIRNGSEDPLPHLALARKNLKSKNYAEAIKHAEKSSHLTTALLCNRLPEELKKELEPLKNYALRILTIARLMTEHPPKQETMKNAGGLLDLPTNERFDQDDLFYVALGEAVLTHAGEPHLASCCFFRATATNKDNQKTIVELLTRLIKEHTEERYAPMKSACHWIRGELHRKSNENQKALDDFTYMVENDSTNANGWFGRGLAHHNLGHMLEALRDLKKACELAPSYDPNPQRFYTALVKSLTDKIPDLLKNKELDKVERICTDILSVDSRNHLALGYRATALLNLKKFSQGAKDLEHALATEPNNEKIKEMKQCLLDMATDITKAAQNFFAQKDYVSAAEFLTKAIELDPGNIHYYMSRGQAYMATKEYQKAIEDFSTVITEKSDTKTPFRLRGETRLALGQHKEAVADFETYAARCPEKTDHIKSLQRAKDALEKNEYSSSVNATPLTNLFNPKEPASLPGSQKSSTPELNN